jgi:hypothetical protein
MIRNTTIAVLVVVTLLSGALAPMAVTAAPETQTAQLAIDQPSFVEGSVTQQREDGQVIYSVQHGTVELKPQNFDADSVVGFGAEEGGSLTYDEEMDQFRFDVADGETGTFTLYWEVRGAPTGNATNGSGEAVRRHEAVVDVESNGEYQHLAAGSLERIREDADIGQRFREAAVDIFGEDVVIEDQLQASINFMKLRNNPLRALAGGYTSTWMLLILGGAGANLVLVTILGFALFQQRHNIALVNRYVARGRDETEVREQLRDLDLKEKIRVLSRVDFQDIWPDDRVARAYRRLAETPFRAIQRLRSVRDPANLLSYRLQAMGQCGYVGAVDCKSDGTTDYETARVLPEDEYPDDADTVEKEELSNPDDKFVEALLGTGDPEVVNFDLPGADFDPDAISVTAELKSVDEFLEEMELRRDDFENPEEFGEYLRQMLEFVRQHEITDPNGEMDEIDYILTVWVDEADLMGDRYGLPQIGFEAEAITADLEQRDAVEQASNAVERLQSGVNVG